jgi:hypothetical protein
MAHLHSLLPLALLLFWNTAIAQSSAVTNRTSRYAYGQIENTCGPTDQSMLLLTLTSVPPKKHEQPATPRVSVMLDAGPVLPKTLVFPARNKILNAVRCAPNCEPVPSGTIVIESLDRKGASGHYDLKFSDGTEDSGTFQVKWSHEGKVLCG